MVSSANATRPTPASTPDQIVRLICLPPHHHQQQRAPDTKWPCARTPCPIIGIAAEGLRFHRLVGCLTGTRFPRPRRLCAAASAWKSQTFTGMIRRLPGTCGRRVRQRARESRPRRCRDRGTNRVGPGASVAVAARGWSGLSTGPRPRAGRRFALRVPSAAPRSTAALNRPKIAPCSAAASRTSRPLQSASVALGASPSLKATFQTCLKMAPAGTPPSTLTSMPTGLYTTLVIVSSTARSLVSPR